VFDPAAQWTVDAKDFRSKGRNTPYAGRTLNGRVHATIVGGQVIHRLAR
jgi:dihydroorotase